MKCPNDGNQLVMSERQGVEIDYCPECRGVWLDRGELDKILDKNSQATHSPQLSTDRPDQTRARHDDQSDRHGTYHQPRKKKESFLGEIFDF